jgi:SAM-dependent methyltransferase
MTERLYTEHPDLYDAIQSEWDYDRDVDFVADRLDDHDVTGPRLLEAGCGTGEHTRRFAERGVDVTAVDPFEGMLDAARQKCDDANYRTDSLPDLGVSGTYDVIVAIRGVVNHLPPEHIEPALETLSDRLADGGVLIFDNSPLPPAGNDPGLDVGETPDGRYVRVAQMQPRADDRLDWVAVTFTPDGEVFTNVRQMTPFADERIADALSEQDLAAETHDGYGPNDHRTVFVATK